MTTPLLVLLLLLPLLPPTNEINDNSNDSNNITIMIRVIKMKNCFRFKKYKKLYILFSSLFIRWRKSTSTLCLRVLRLSLLFREFFSDTHISDWFFA